ncbi:uncharacterized protein LOC133176264 [Saccostrea echinata]|uniref:uncharacterized protein LOC133176264 n=1 Tax=Saccostrea echinata TaxID=191078 RepID=UPI002A7FD159|nr:uncharacterized protein LOC133176264 [Saccostrea echinata]
MADRFGKKNKELDTFLVEEIELQWSSLADCLNVTENELLKLQTCILKRFSDLKRIDLGEKNSECIKIISDVFANRYTLIDEQIRTHTAELRKSESFEHLEVYLDETECDMNTTILRRTLSPPSVECLLGEITIKRYEEKYPFLYHLLSRLHILRLLQLLQPILKWQKAIGVFGKYILRKCECRTLTVSGFIDEKCSKSDFRKVKYIFQDFMENWNEIFSGNNVDILHTVEPNIKPLLAKPDEKIGMFMIIDQSSQLLLVLKALIKIQNNFLEDVISIARTSKCLPLSFLENPKTSQFHHISLFELQDRDILPHSFPKDALLFCQRSVKDPSVRVIYDFPKIESEVSVEYLTNAKFISFKEQSLLIQFKDDISQNTILLLKALYQMFNQTGTDKQRLDKIRKMLSENELDKNSKLLTVLGIVAAMEPHEEIKKKNCVPMIDYFKEYEFEFALTNFEHAIPADAQLGDLVFIYETLEEFNGERVIISLEEAYRTKLSNKVIQELNLVDQARTSWEKILVGIKLFAHRFIWNNASSLSTETRLQDYMIDDSFWSVRISNDEKIGLTMRMPENIRVRHICHLFSILQSELKNETTITKEIVEERHKLSIAAKAKSRQLKSRKRLTVGKS